MPSDPNHWLMSDSGKRHLGGEAKGDTGGVIGGRAQFWSLCSGCVLTCQRAETITARQGCLRRCLVEKQSAVLGTMAECDYIDGLEVSW
jgi:hypothetical protein